jgi:uncharacterized protein (TIRG00374 family)
VESVNREEAGQDRPTPDGVAWYANWKFWLGIGISVGCLWYVARGIPIAKVVSAMGRANLPLLFAMSVPCYLVSTWVRGLRWRHFINPIAEIDRPSLFRAQAIGFMVNNLVPLRIGEFVRSWSLAREHRLSATAILGTVVIERVVDLVTVLLLVASALTWAGRGSDSLLAQGASLLLPVACIPIGGLVILRVFPDQVISIARSLSRPLDARFGEMLEKLVRSFSEGLGSLTPGPHLFWILVHTIVIWLCLSMLPMLAGILAFGMDLGTPAETLMISYAVLAGIGVAVAIPSAPGFFGTYQLACKSVLERFGVDPAEALAMGLLVWFVFWITHVVLGLVVIRSQRTSLSELTLRPSKDPIA